VLDSELFWAVVWALIHVAGVIAVLVLRSRSQRQLRIAEHWREQAAPPDRQEADDLVLLTRDRHRRNGVLVAVVGGYLLLGVLVLSYALDPWLDGAAYRVISRLILVGSEVALIGSAWASVVVGDQIARRTAVTKEGDS
jgi:hypothetical protein